MGGIGNGRINTTKRSDISWEIECAKGIHIRRMEKYSVDFLVLWCSSIFLLRHYLA